MQTSSRLSTATHMMILTYTIGDRMKLTSETMAQSIQVNPVMVRRLMSALKEAGLVTVAAGRGGIRAVRPAEEVTLWDLYAAVEAPAEESLFGFHDCSRSRCPVAQNMHQVLDKHLDDAQHALRDSLERVTLAELCRDMVNTCGVQPETLFAKREKPV